MTVYYVTLAWQDEKWHHHATDTLHPGHGRVTRHGVICEAITVTCEAQTAEDATMQAVALSKRITP